MCNCIHDGFSSAYTIEGDVDFRSRRNLFGWHSPRVEWNEFHRRTGGVSPDVCKVSACAGWTPLSCKEKEVYSQRVMVSNRIVWDLDGEIAMEIFRQIDSPIESLAQNYHSFDYFDCSWISNIKSSMSSSDMERTIGLITTIFI